MIQETRIQTRKHKSVSFNLSKIEPDQPDNVKKREAKNKAKISDKKYYKKVDNSTREQFIDLVHK